MREQDRKKIQVKTVGSTSDVFDCETNIYSSPPILGTSPPLKLKYVTLFWTRTGDKVDSL